MHHCTLSSDRSGSAYAAFALVGSPPSTVAAAVTAGRCRTWLSRDGAQQRENVGNEAGTGVRLPWTRQRCQSACSGIASANVRTSSRAPKNLFFHARKRERYWRSYSRVWGQRLHSLDHLTARLLPLSTAAGVTPARCATALRHAFECGRSARKSQHTTHFA